MKTAQRKNSKWTSVRWMGGRVISSGTEGCACVARHLYMNDIWCGVLSGMTDSMEKRILDALNNEQPKLEQ